MNLISTILRDELRLLTFREFRPNLHEHWKAYLAFGLFWTWLAGVGRYWDNPRAELWQLLGLGSVGYVFVLALVLWLIILPLGPRNWSYRNVLIFITLTAPPAVLYAIPVEQFMPLKQAQTANVWFLAVVATWRVILLWLFLRRAAGLSGFAVIVAALLPLVLIVTALTVLNLEHVIFNLMAGIRDEQKTSNDAAYFTIVGLTIVSFYSLPFLFAAYIWQITVAHARRRAAKTWVE